MFGRGGGFESSCCKFFVEFAGTSASDAVGDQRNDELEADNAENAGYGTGVGKESKMKIGLVNFAHNNGEFEREIKNYEFRKGKIEIENSNQR